MSLRQFYIESDLKYSVFSILFFGILALFAVLIPKDVLLTYEMMLFALAFFHITFVTDPLAWMPFAMTHTVFANGFAIPLAIVSARIAFNFSFALPNLLMLTLIFVWWASILFHFFTSESFIFSYFGGIERQMGMMYRFTIPLYLFVAWQVFHFMSPTFLFVILIVGAILETMVLTLQFLDEEKHIKYPFSYLKSIGFRRYTGTISNPIPVANFLVTVLPLTFALYKPNYEFIFFIVSYLVISWGLILSHGRGSYLATLLVSVLEIIYVLLLLTSMPIYMTILALAVILFAPLYYLFTPQGKIMKNKLKDVVDFAKRKIFKHSPSNSAFQSQEQTVKESSNVNRAFIWREAVKSFKLHPLLGYGISNIARALRRNFSRRSASYFMTQVVDRSHNHYLDLLLEGGITHLLIYLALLGLAIYSSVANGMAWIAIAIIGYSFDLLFSFPLQINYFVLMVIISVSMGVNMVSYPFVGYIFLGLSAVYLLDLYFASKENTAMRYVQMALSVQRNDIKIALDSALSALKTVPFEQRFFTQSANILEFVSSTGKLKLEDLHTFRIWFNASKGFIIKNAEAPDVPFATMAMVYSVVFASTKDKNYGNECWSLIKSSLKMNPSSIMARKALFTLLTALANTHLQNKENNQALLNFKQSEAVLRRIIEDFINAPAANYDLENPYWQAYFDILKKLEMYKELQKYFDVYKKRFKTVIFTYDIFTKISKVFNTPVSWTVINTNGTRILYPVNTILGSLTKRVWKFSRGKSAELYLTVGQNAKISESAIRPFMEEFMKQDWWTYWKDEGFIG